MAVPLFFRDLCGFPSNDLRNTSIALNHAGHTNSLPLVHGFRLAKLRAIISPDDDSENLLWIWLVKIEECWLTSTRIRVMRADHLAAHGCIRPDVVLGLGCGDRIGAACVARKQDT